MNELIERMVSQSGITREQAIQCIDTVKEYIKEKFPFVAGAVDKVLGDDTQKTEPDDY
jgi:hypothetical protein